MFKFIKFYIVILRFYKFIIFVFNIAMYINNFQAEEVAEKLMNDSLSGKFYSTIGLEGFMLTTMCAGMGPITHLSDFIFQVSLTFKIKYMIIK